MALCGRKKYRFPIITSGDYFPMRNEDSFVQGTTTDSIGEKAGISFYSEVSQEISFDLNDGGEPIKVNAIGGSFSGVFHYVSNPSSVNKQGRFYKDGDSGNRIVYVTFEEPQHISKLYIGYTIINSDLPINIGNFIGLNSIDIQYIRGTKFNDLPTTVLNLVNLVFASFVLSFDTSSLYNKVYPIELLNSNLEKISVIGTDQGKYANTLDTVSTNNNWDKLHLLKNTLKEIDVSSSGIGNGDLKSTVIDSWVKCNLLEKLSINSNNCSAIYSQLNRLTKLKYINVGGGLAIDYDLTDWGDLSNLVNLEEFDGSASYYSPTTLPSYFKVMNKLRKINLDWNYTAQHRWDAVMVDLYNMVVNNAPITNDDSTNQVALRNTTISLKPREVGSLVSYIPTGIYQQPTGYIQGVSNGTPASQLEKIWVLANQYKVIVQYTDNR